MPGPHSYLPPIAFILFTLFAAPAHGQKALEAARGAPVILNSDLAVLADTQQRADLPCRVDWSKPQMSFDLRFHATYRVQIPLKELSGEGNQLRILMRVTPEGAPENTLYLTDRFSVPPIEEDAKGDAYVGGEYTLGPGRYRVDWLMRDRTERVCSEHWALEAVADDDYNGVELAIAPNTVEPRPQDPFQETTPVDRDAQNKLLHVKLLVNFSPTDPRESTLKPWDVRAITSIVRTIAREPSIGTFSVVAFSMNEERVIYRQDHSTFIDFPALGEAVNGMQLGTVQLSQLADPESGPRFLASLLTEHLGAQKQPVDAVIIVGPKVMLQQKIPEEMLTRPAAENLPVFYFSYNSNPRKNIWRDTITTALKVYRGLAYSITLPRDLGTAVSDMMPRLTHRE
jgi:hypothetical protein